MESQSKSSWMSSACKRCIWKFLEGIMCCWFICAWCPGEGTEGGETCFKTVEMELSRGLIHLFLCHLSSWAPWCSLGPCGDILGDPSWTYSVWNPCRDFLHRQQRNHSPFTCSETHGPLCGTLSIFTSQSADMRTVGGTQKVYRTINKKSALQ